MTHDGTSILERDPVTFEVVRSALYAICAEMKSVIMRTSFSPLLSLSADLSCALLDREGRVVAQGNDIPVHLGAARFTADAIFRAFPVAQWKPRDAVITNDPYSGGTHLPDVSMLTPVFSGDTLLGFALSRIHWPDVGGIARGSSSVSDEIIKEGLRIPPLKIVEEGRVREDALGLILANVRVPSDREGDFRAAIAGHLRAEARLQGLAEKYSAPAIVAIMGDTQAYSRSLVDARLRELPDTVVHHAEPLDGDGVDPDAAPVIRVAIEKRGTSLCFDFTGSDACVAGPVNAPIAVTSSAVFYTVLAFAGGDIAPNSGVYDNVEIVAPEGSVVNATYPAPVVAANTETANRLADILIAALGKSYPDRVSGGGYGSACVYTLGGRDPRRDSPFVHYETIGGGMGATRDMDGASGLRVHMGNTMNLPVEATEALVPVRFVDYALVRGSGGDGQRCGGLGVRKTLVALTGGIEASILGERTRSPAHGAAGGEPGACASFAIVGSDGTRRELGAKSGPHRLAEGDRLEMVTAGGGGWGEA
ncbi:hydantoinase B/oxoprolinase family protein [Acuticoccus sediminis]|uniref:hydantoinase B/oxoprolinase family protein n=1 Tax=Acuticoccus sediminis TaxID=2184697 RepID=UPI001CFF3CCF|nr:hydantoinase B/oxoprolinase family protein [Acuticoccus sediminis]